MDYLSSNFLEPMAISLLLAIPLVGLFFLLPTPQHLEDLVYRVGDWSSMIIHQSMERLKRTANDFNIREGTTPVDIKLIQEDAAYYNHLTKDAPGWVSFLRDLYLGGVGIRREILQLDVHAPDAREQMRAIAARLIHCVLATTYNDISIYHATISPQDSPDEENDDLKNRCELFGEVTEVLIDRLEEALDQHEQELQAISRLNRQAAALQAARSDVERQQAEIKKQEEDLKAEWENARGEAQERAGEDHLDASKHLDALTMMRREFLRGMSDDLGEKGEADHKEEETNTI